MGVALRWSWDPTVIAGVLVAGWVYWHGFRRVWQHPGVRRRLLCWQAAAYVAGLGMIVVALLSPIDYLSRLLFSAHMVQHLLLMLAAAPLFVISQPAQPLLWGLPVRWRRRVGHWQHAAIWRRSWGLLSRPLMAWWIQTVVLWGWHVPGAYDTALSNPWIHSFEHLTLLGSAMLFWYSVFPFSRHRSFSYGAAVASDFLTAVQMTVLAIALTFAPSPIYGYSGATIAIWGLSPLQDQQIAGLIMWIPASGVYLLACLAIVALWIASAEREARKCEGPPLRPRLPFARAESGDFSGSRGPFDDGGLNAAVHSER